ncbi:hypothetical protein EDB89DRAFT_1903984 [Lactarius sanguifluus]|nr:hypothetical protein EDB89DRAFT_1910986 [Lactarius sanguifluus]KAH9175526.1 hypothetical protein EDB89DRAFT_1903984 [Lactarius sanguifluus]
MRTVLWGLVVAALHAVLRRGRSAGSCTMWCDVVGYWCVSGQGGGWRGGRWQLGLVCRVEVAWRGLAHRVEVTWRGLGVCWGGGVVWVGGGGAGWRGFAFSRVLHAMLGQRSGLAVVGVGAGWRWLACTNGLQHPRFVCRVEVAGWWWRRVASHVWGGVVGAGTNGSSSCARGDGNGLQC